MRAVALGRKNYLLAGSDAGGARAAAIHSLIASAKLHGLDQVSRREVLARIADFLINRIEELLARNIASSLPPEQKQPHQMRVNQSGARAPS